MRVAQLTLLSRNYTHNFGAALQAYALHRLLALDDHQVELIDYLPTSFTLSHRLRSFYRSTKTITNREGPMYILRKFPTWLSKKSGKNKHIPEFRERIKKFEEFSGQYIKFTTNTFHEINELRIF